jgi:hypothetical protein
MNLGFHLCPLEDLTVSGLAPFRFVRGPGRVHGGEPAAVAQVQLPRRWWIAAMLARSRHVVVVAHRKLRPD